MLNRESSLLPVDEGTGGIVAGRQFDAGGIAAIPEQLALIRVQPAGAVSVTSQVPGVRLLKVRSAAPEVVVSSKLEGLRVWLVNWKVPSPPSVRLTTFRVSGWVLVKTQEAFAWPPDSREAREAGLLNRPGADQRSELELLLFPPCSRFDVLQERFCLFG